MGWIESVLDKFEGLEWWIVVGAIALAAIGTLWIRTKRKEKTLFWRVLLCWSVCFLCAVTAIWAHRKVTRRTYVFPENLAGIMVMEISGDRDGSLQRHLVSSLNTELAKSEKGQPIEVRSVSELVNEGIGLANSHKSARALGKEFRANLVIWGNRAGERAFYPRITVVEQADDGSLIRDRVMDVQDILDLTLPKEVVNEPIYLIHVLTGYSFFERKDFRSAAKHFERALTRKSIADDQESADIRFLCGNAHYLAADLQRDADQRLKAALAAWTGAAEKVKREISPFKWAMLQHNLGAAYRNLPSGNRRVNLQKAIDAYEAALTVHTEKDYPAQWAMTQNNLGNAYNAVPIWEEALRLTRQRCGCIPKWTFRSSGL